MVCNWGVGIVFKRICKQENLNDQRNNIDPGEAIMYAYAAISVGDILIGLISQWLKSRKKALYLFYVILPSFMVFVFHAI